MITAKEARELSKKGEQDLIKETIASLENDISEACQKGLYEVKCPAFILRKEVEKYFTDLGYEIESDDFSSTTRFISWYEEDI